MQNDREKLLTAVGQQIRELRENLLTHIDTISDDPALAGNLELETVLALQDFDKICQTLDALDQVCSAVGEGADADEALGRVTLARLQSKLRAHLTGEQQAAETPQSDEDEIELF